jgi:hydroxyethylthiazole kinase-like uncharacterized protein yjeF
MQFGVNTMLETLSENILAEVIVRRPDDSHKGNFGRVLIIGGNQQYGGAGLMAASGAFNAGAGLVTLATDPVNLAALHTRTPEVMFLDWHDDVSLSSAILSSDVILIGPGLGTDNEAERVLRLTFQMVNSKHSLIVDGSALTLMANRRMTFPATVFTIATPHQMEWQRLSGLQIADQAGLTMNQAQRQSLNLDILVLKQHHTLILSEMAEKQLMIGGAYQAVGGMGDTLAGIIAGFVAQFPDRQKAVQAAVYAHSALAERMAGHSYIVKPSFIADGMPNFMAGIQTNL